MTLPSRRWQRIVFGSTLLVFAAVAFYIFALRFWRWSESDAAVPALLAARMIEAKRPIVDSWYYANGDVWFLSPQMLAVVPVAILGIGPASLWISVVGGFVLEVVAMVRMYARLCDARWVAVLAGVCTLAVWSKSHVMYVYIQLSYGFGMVFFLALYTVVARVFERPSLRLRLGMPALLAVIAVQNPTRGLVFLLAPALATCVWPWREVGWRRRAEVTALLIAGWAVAWLGYTHVFAPAVVFSQPPGHIAFKLAGLHGMAANLGRLARGMRELAGGDGSVLWALPGLAVLAGALALVATELFATRAVTTLRLLCVMAGAQLVGVCVPLLAGNLLVSVDSARYAMPSVLILVGLAVVVASRTLATTGWPRRLAAGWLCLLPITLALAAREARPPRPVRYVWPDLRELAEVADQIVAHKLTRGFSNVLSANVLNLQSHGETLACPIYFRISIVPQRWLADTSCYDPARLPETFYVVVDEGEHDAIAVREALPPPIDRFRAGPSYEVLVFRTAEMTKPWLALPMADGELARFPWRIPATHLQMARGESIVDGDRVIGTGTPGTVIYGPYIALPRGRYELVWYGAGMDTPGDLEFSVRSNGAETVIARVTQPARALPRAGELVRIPFTLKRLREGIEFLVRTTGGGRVALEHLEIVRAI